MPQRKEALALSPPPVLSRFLQQEGIMRRVSVSEVVFYYKCSEDHGVPCLNGTSVASLTHLALCFVDSAFFLLLSLMLFCFSITKCFGFDSCFSSCPSQA